MHESICNMTELTALTLQNCGIEAISPCISNLRKLRFLDLGRNCLAEVRSDAGLLSVPPPEIFVVYRWPSVGLGRMQVPQELSSLTQLTKLNLYQNAAASTSGEPAGDTVQDEDGNVLRPKMRVTEQGCRYLLTFGALRTVYLTVTKEERAALAGFRADMRRVRKGRNVVYLRLSEAFIRPR